MKKYFMMLKKRVPGVRARHRLRSSRQAAAKSIISSFYFLFWWMSKVLNIIWTRKTYGFASIWNDFQRIFYWTWSIIIIMDETWVLQTTSRSLFPINQIRSDKETFKIKLIPPKKVLIRKIFESGCAGSRNETRHDSFCWTCEKYEWRIRSFSFNKKGLVSFFTISTTFKKHNT